MEDRKRDILKAVVEEFTASAIPVGSQALARERFINLSAATIRTELSELAELGYLAQTHTSSGRIPTDRGYRYFVDFLMVEEAIPSQITSYIGEELRSAPIEAQALAEKVANTVAVVTRNAAIATTPYGAHARIKHVDFVSLE
ncbi:MAG: heat-inducible transcriptional repressor HrcA, partial [Candidatus Dormibacteraceae bacterium]